MKRLKTTLSVLVGSVLIAVPVVFLSLALADTDRNLENLHMEEMRVESEIAELKPDIILLEKELSEKKSQMDELRKKREEIVEKRNTIINSQYHSILPEADASELEIHKEIARKENPETAWYGECSKAKTGEDYQEKLDYMVEYTKGDMEFIYTVHAENGGLQTFARNYNSNGSYDVGLCQLNSTYHSAFINSDEFKDWKNQVAYCYDVWNDAWSKNRIWTTFYAYKHRYARAKAANLKCND